MEDLRVRILSGLMSISQSLKQSLHLWIRCFFTIISLKVQVFFFQINRHCTKSICITSLNKLKILVYDFFVYIKSPLQGLLVSSFEVDSKTLLLRKKYHSFLRCSPSSFYIVHTEPDFRST